MIVPLSFPLPLLTAALLDLDRLAEIECPEESFLTDGERESFRLLGSPKRRREWLGARVCLKTMLLRAGRIRGAGDCEILKDPRGRPSLAFPAGRGGEGGDCSLSHKGKYAAAALASAGGVRVGIDIEHLSPRAARLRDSFVNRRDRLPGVTGADRFHTVLWTVKEAASKVLGTGLGAGLQELVCRQTGDGLCRVGREGAGEDMEGAFLFKDDYTVTVVSGRVLTRGRSR